MAKPVRVVFNADTGQFVSAVDGGTASVQKQAEAVAAAKNKVLQFGQQQLKTAEENGASQKQLQRIYEQTLTQITSVSESNAQRVIAGKDRIIEKNKQVAESQKQLAQVFEMPIVAEHDDVTNKQRASAVLRGGGVRAGEQFLTQFDIFNKFATVAFPVLGAAALGKEVFHIVEGLKKVYDEAEHVGVALSEAFEQSHSKAQVTIDDLAVQADKLQDNIDKLHGHPGDGLKLALDEARRYADKLRESLIADRTELQKLFKEQNVGAFGSLLSGVAMTGRQHDELLQDHRDVEKDIDRAVSAYNAKAAKATNLEQLKGFGSIRDSAIEAALQAPIDRYRIERERLVKEQADSEAAVRNNAANYASTQSLGASTPARANKIDNSAKIAGLDLASGRYQDFVNTFRAQNRVSDLTEQNLKAEQDKENAKLAKEGSSKAQEAARKAAEEQRKQWDYDLASMQTYGKASAETIHQFWVAVENSTVKGSENYYIAQKHANETLKTVNDEKHKLVDEMIKWHEQTSRAGLKDALAVVEPGIAANGKGVLDSARTYRELQDAQQKAALTVAESNVQYDLQAGRISRSDAALQIQTLHTMAYEQALARLNEQLGAVQDGPEAGAQRNRIQTQIVDLDSKRSVEVMQDAAAAAGTTWQGALTNANAAWVQNSRDSARQVQQLYSQAIDGVNSNVVAAMTGSRTDWSGMFRGLGQTLGRTALEHVEAPILGALGMGKNDGSDSNPLAVKIVNPGSLGGMLGGTGNVVFGDAGLGGLHKLFAGGGDDSDGGSGFLGRATSFLGGMFGGHFALGGDVEAGVPIDVGEMGREMFVPKTAGTIIPNNKLGGNTTVHVDARGATNPAEVEAAARRAVLEAAPHIVAAASAASRDSRARTPSSLNR